MSYKQFLETGKIVATHGIAGEVRIQPWCDEAELLTEFDAFYFDAAGKTQRTVERARVHKNVVVVKFKGVDSVEEAQSLRNQIVYIDREELELPEGTYFIQDLIGLEVLDADDPQTVYGTLCEVSQPGANDVYHIRRPDGTENLIPAIPDVVVQTDLDGNRMFIRPLKGLFDDED